MVFFLLLLYKNLHLRLLRITFIILLLLSSCSRKEELNVETNEIIKDSLIATLNNLKVKDSSKKSNIGTMKYLLDELSSKENTKQNRENLANIIENFNKSKEWNFLNLSNKFLLDWSKESKDTINLGNAYFYFGNSYFDEGVYDSAFFYYLKAEKIFLLKSNYRLGDLYLNKSNIQLNFNDNLGAENSATKSLKYYRAKDDLYSQYDALTNLGIASYSNENFEKAIEYHKKALEIARNSKIDKKFYLEEISLNNIGNCLQNLKSYIEAISYFKKALKNKTLYAEKPGLYATLSDNLAYSEFKLNGRSQETLNLFLKALRIRDSLQLESRIIYSKIHLSEYYSYINDSAVAKRYSKEALELSKETKIFYDILLALKQCSLVDSQNSSKYSEEYIRISDSLQQEERKSKDKFARIAFETDEIIQEKDKLAEQNRNLLYFFLGTLFVGILLFVIRTQRAKNRELLLKQQQQKVNEEIYNLMITQQSTIEENRVKEKKRIAQELHDGVLGRLFGARLNLDSLNRFTDEESVNSRFNYLAELKNIEQDIREISHDLNREKYVLINNFVAIVSNLLEEQSNSFEAALISSLDESIQWDKVANNVKINLYRILQESLQNINKYANAKNISVELRKVNGQIVLKISDDGIGFDVNTKKKGIGLQNMQSRVQECEGTFEIKSKKGKGTTTVVMVPLEKVSVDL
jgi:signal transduction histidine kinase